MTLLTASSKRPPQPCCETKSESRTLPNQLLHVSPEYLGQQVAFALHRFCSDESCVTGFSLRANCWLLTHPLQWSFCTAQRFHFEGEEERCRVECPDEPDSLSRMSPVTQLLLALVCGQATLLPRRGHLFHDLITQLFLRTIQYGIAVMGVIDDLIYAHDHHRRNMEKSRTLRRLHERENSLYDRNHSGICPRVTVNLPGRTCSLCSPFKISPAGCQGQRSASSRRSYHNTLKRQ